MATTIKKKPEKPSDLLQTFLESIDRDSVNNLTEFTGSKYSVCAMIKAGRESKFIEKYGDLALSEKGQQILLRLREDCASGEWSEISQQARDEFLRLLTTQNLCCTQKADNE